jgi:hypothetical protein
MPSQKRAGGVAQVVGPELKPYSKKKKKKEKEKRKEKKKKKKKKKKKLITTAAYLEGNGWVGGRGEDISCQFF